MAIFARPCTIRSCFKSRIPLLHHSRPCTSPLSAVYFFLRTYRHVVRVRFFVCLRRGLKDAVYMSAETGITLAGYLREAKCQAGESMDFVFFFKGEGLFSQVLWPAKGAQKHISNNIIVKRTLFFESVLFLSFLINFSWNKESTLNSSPPGKKGSGAKRVN